MQNADQVYREYRSRLLAFIQQRVGARALAEDILHDMFVKLVGRETGLREPAKLTAWLYQVTRNAIVDRFRADRRHEELPQAIADDRDELTAEARLAGCMRPMIDALPEIYRNAISLSDLDGLPLKAIAERAGISVSAVKSRVQRGRRMLETMLTDCCTLELSRHGEIMDFWPKADGRGSCSTSRSEQTYAEQS